MEALKILIVDDSMFFREVLARGLATRIPANSTIEKAGDPFEARDKILSFDPEVMILDVEMPHMNGIEFLRRLIVQYALPTVVLSSRPAYKDLALEAGAYSFIEKPSTTLGSGDFVSKVANEIIKARSSKPKVYNQDTAVGTSSQDVNNPVGNSNPQGLQDTIAANLHEISRNMRQMVEESKRNRPAVQPPSGVAEKIAPPVAGKPVRLIAIGASTGGTEALAVVLKALQPPLPPIVIVQHIPPMFSKLFSDRLNNECHLRVKEAENGDKLEPNWVYVAPGDKQMRVKSFGNVMTLEVQSGPKVNGHCPSVDVLFDSVAEKIGDGAMGVILTGMGEDGARGLLKMRQQGAITLGQDEASCVVYGMPRAAYEKGAVTRQLPLGAMSGMITIIAGHQGGK